jgi:hypothetical protein
MNRQHVYRHAKTTRWNDREGNRLRDMATRRVKDEIALDCFANLRFGSEAGFMHATHVR